MRTLQDGRGFILDDDNGTVSPMVLETCALYSFQIAMENFHFEILSLLLDNYVKDSAQKIHLFRIIDTIYFIAIFRKTFVSSFANKILFHWERSREVPRGPPRSSYKMKPIHYFIKF
ncbi:putative ribonucleoside-diphosphate reductase small chain B, partial [Mucuna pruriens]